MTAYDHLNHAYANLHRASDIHYGVMSRQLTVRAIDALRRASAPALADALERGLHNSHGFAAYNADEIMTAISRRMLTTQPR